MLKKNIAKLLVFAMILSMLPFSAVSVGAVTPRNGEKDGGGYALISDAYVLGTDSKQLKLDKKTGLGTTEDPYTLTADSYIVVDDTNKSVTLNFEVNNNTNSIYDLGSDVTNWSLSGKTGSTVPTNKWVTKTITPTIGNDGSAKVKACYAVYSNSKDATCYQLEFTAKKLYTVAVGTCTNGTLTVSANKAVAGAEISVTATPAPGYKLQEISVTGANVAVQNGKFTMPASNVTVNATFVINSTEKKEYAISSDITPANSGSVTFKVGDSTTSATQAVAGAKVTATASATTDYTFKSMSGTYTLEGDTKTGPFDLKMKQDETDKNVYTFTMPAGPVTVKAEFEKVESTKRYAINVQDMENGTVTVSPEANKYIKENGVYLVEKDAVVTLTVLPKTDDYMLTADSLLVEYKIGNDTKSITPEGGSGIYTFKMPECEVDIKAAFEQRKLKVTFAEDHSTPAEGLLTITGTSPLRWYFISETKNSLLKGGEATAYLIVKGSEKGIDVPCEKDVSLNIKEMATKDKTGYDNGWLFVKGKKTVYGATLPLEKEKPKGYAPKPVQTLTDGNEDEGTVEEEISAPTVTFVEDDSTPAGGRLTLKNTLASKWYFVSETKKSLLKGGEATAYLIVKGSKADVEIPCEKDVSLNLKRMHTKDKKGYDEGWLFVKGQKTVFGATLKTEPKP